MPNLSIKAVPLDELNRLRDRAKRNHRSVQGELRTILSEALGTREAAAAAKPSLEEVVAEIRRTALRTPPESVQMIREDRNGR
jgi:plasmid stability protein